MKFVFPFVSWRSAEEKGGYVWGGNGPVSRSIEGWEEGFIVFVYPQVFTVS